MSDSLVRKIVVVNPTTDERETRYLATSAKNVDNLDSFIGLGIDGNVGPITKLTGQAAFDALFTDAETQSWVLPYGFKGVAYKIGNSLVGAYIEQIDFSLRLNSTSVYKIFYAKGLADEKFTLSCNGVSGERTTVPFKAYVGSVEQAGTFNLVEEYNSDGQLVFNGSFSSLPSTATFAADFINSEGFWLVSKYGKTLLETEDKKRLDNLDGTNILLDKSSSTTLTIKNKIDSFDNIFNSETASLTYANHEGSEIINGSTIIWTSGYGQRILWKGYYAWGRIIKLEIYQILLYYYSGGSSGNVIPGGSGIGYNLSSFLNSDYANKILKIEYNESFPLVRMGSTETSLEDTFSLASFGYDVSDNSLHAAMSPLPSTIPSVHALEQNVNYSEPLITFYF